MVNDISSDPFVLKFYNKNNVDRIFWSHSILDKNICLVLSFDDCKITDDELRHSNVNYSFYNVLIKELHLKTGKVLSNIITSEFVFSRRTFVNCIGNSIDLRTISGKIELKFKIKNKKRFEIEYVKIINSK